MATSTNYGWSEPDNTSLVKDGALAIRTLGNAIDTSLWNSGYGQAGKNKLINGAMEQAQRGTSISVNSTAYTLDRWFAAPYGSGGTFTVAQGTTSPPTNFSNYARILANNTTLINMVFAQSLETKDVVRFAGKTVTASWYYKNAVNATNTWNFTSYYTTGTDAKAYVATATQIATVVIANNSAWTRATLTFTVPSSATSFGVEFANYNNIVNAAELQVTGVMVEVGSTATPFQTASGGSIQNELAMCQRYYWRTSSGNVSGPYGVGYAKSTTSGNAYIQCPVTMRTTPTSIDFSTLCLYESGVAFYPIGALAFDGVNNLGVNLQFSSVTGTLVLGKPYIISNNNSTNGYLGLSAEL